MSATDRSLFTRLSCFSSPLLLRSKPLSAQDPGLRGGEPVWWQAEGVACRYRGEVGEGQRIRGGKGEDTVPPCPSGVQATSRDLLPAAVNHSVLNENQPQVQGENERTWRGRASFLCQTQRSLGEATCAWNVCQGSARPRASLNTCVVRGARARCGEGSQSGDGKTVSGWEAASSVLSGAWALAGPSTEARTHRGLWAWACLREPHPACGTRVPWGLFVWKRYPHTSLGTTQRPLAGRQPLLCDGGLRLRTPCHLFNM